jgi:hypothetical protein
LRSRCEERLGDPRAAEASLDATRALDARWPPVLEDLARYAAERGDATAAISLLRQAGVADDDDELAFLLALASPARPDLGRNQPCWCGSGRKYKVCHRGREALPLADRAGRRCFAIAALSLGPAAALADGMPIEALDAESARLTWPRGGAGAAAAAALEIAVPAGDPRRGGHLIVYDGGRDPAAAWGGAATSR